MNNFEESSMDRVGEYVFLVDQGSPSDNDVHNFEKMLIKKAGEYDALVNPRGRSHKDSNKRHKAWREVAAALGEPVQKCKQRWRSLRERFMREKEKMEDSLNKEYYEHFEWEFYSIMERCLNGAWIIKRESESSDEDTSAKRRMNFEEFLTESNCESSSTKRCSQKCIQPAEFCEKLSETLAHRFGVEQADDNEMFMKFIERKVKHLPARNKTRLQERIFQLVNEEVVTYLESS